MRHALLHNPRRIALRRVLSRHRPRTPGRSGRGEGEARVSDILLAIAGLVVLGALALYAALLLVERTVPM